MKNSVDFNEFEKAGDFKGAMDAWLLACQEVEAVRKDLQARAKAVQEAKFASENERRALRRADPQFDASTHLARESEMNALYWDLMRQSRDLSLPEKPDLIDFPGAEF